MKIYVLEYYGVYADDGNIIIGAFTSWEEAEKHAVAYPPKLYANDLWCIIECELDKPLLPTS